MGLRLEALLTLRDFEDLIRMGLTLDSRSIIGGDSDLFRCFFFSFLACFFLDLCLDFFLLLSSSDLRCFLDLEIFGQGAGVSGLELTAAAIRTGGSGLSDRSGSDAEGLVDLVVSTGNRSILLL